MNKNIDQLHAYPFQRLSALKSGITPNPNLLHISLSIGEPKHPTPHFIHDAIIQHVTDLSQYPTTKGIPALRNAIAQWLKQRFKLKHLDSESQILPVNGTREALFAFAQAVVDDSKPNPLVLIPNPFYQIYEGAVLLAGGNVVYLNTTAENHFIPDFKAITEQQWQDCQLLYLCSPANPTGAITNKAQLQHLIRLSIKYDFIIASDECYSEIYQDEANPPIGLLEAAEELEHHDYKNCVVFHSLSKRSNSPGLRSGFVAGDAEILADFFKYRTYHGCAMPPHHQAASIVAWQDEQHVIENRDLYRRKFNAVIHILKEVFEDIHYPDGGFYLWLKTPEDDIQFTKKLFEQQNVTVLAGQYLSRKAIINPAQNYIRIALVAPLAECIEAAERIKQFIMDEY